MTSLKESVEHWDLDKFASPEAWAEGYIREVEEHMKVWMMIERKPYQMGRKPLLDEVLRFLRGESK